MAEYIKDAGLEPSLVVCTSAARARETVERLRPALPKGTQFKFEPRLYTAGSKELLARIKRLSPAVSSVLIVGHNPAMQDLVLSLASEDRKSAAIRKKFPTAALAVFDAPIDEWKQLAPGGASLVEFVTPRSLRG
jgi:phosphohistidine phosphatase